MNPAIQKYREALERWGWGVLSEAEELCYEKALRKLVPIERLVGA